MSGSPNAGPTSIGDLVSARIHMAFDASQPPLIHEGKTAGLGGALQPRSAVLANDKAAILQLLRENFEDTAPVTEKAKIQSE